VHLDRTSLNRAGMKGAFIAGTVMRIVNLANASLEGAIFKKSKFVDCTEASFKDATWKQCEMDDDTLKTLPPGTLEDFYRANPTRRKRGRGRRRSMSAT
jgi:uncharacterized protein YjbI with pentapeptide repeats